ncbi:MAG: SNF2-related protein [Methanobacterium sp.]
MQIYDYVPELVEQGKKILEKNHLVIFDVKMRIGKSPIALLLIEKMQYKNVLIITKKKAIEGIKVVHNSLKLENNYDKSINIDILNVEQLPSMLYKEVENKRYNDVPEQYKHLIQTKDKKTVKYDKTKLEYFKKYDCIVLDEGHQFGNMKAKTNQRQKNVKLITKDKDVFITTGTLTPESGSQIWHVLNATNRSPFEEKRFNQFAENYCIPKQVRTPYGFVTDWHKCYVDKINEKIKHLIIQFDHYDAEFAVPEITEFFHILPTPVKLANMANELIKDKLIDLKIYGITTESLEVPALTAGAEKIKVTQIVSGTLIDVEHNFYIIDPYKALYIREKFKGQKIVIFYYFKAELELLKRIFPKLTTDNYKFNASQDTDLIGISQMQSGAEGVDWRGAKALIYFDLCYSAVAFQQSRERHKFKDRIIDAEVHYIMSDFGIEKSIYKSLKLKENYSYDKYRKFTNKIIKKG